MITFCAVIPGMVLLFSATMTVVGLTKTWMELASWLLR
jgi:hypothetical protein